MSDFGEKQRGNTEYPNLRPPWPKGVSGNPNGRPRKSEPIEDLLRELLEATELDGHQVKDGRQVAFVLAKGMLADALKGDAKARRDVLERVYGKVPLRIAGPDGGDLAVKHYHVSNSPDEL